MHDRSAGRGPGAGPPIVSLRRPPAGFDHRGGVLRLGQAHRVGFGDHEIIAVPVTVEGPTQLTPLSAPKTSPAQDGQYFTDLAEADPALGSYVQAQRNVALRALLTDGTAFCAFLERGEDIDDAMASVVIGARSLEPQTHLPSTVTTFNTIDAVALLTLCPSYQMLLPAQDRSRIRQLGKALTGKS